MRPWAYIGLLVVAFVAGAAVMWAVSGDEDDGEVAAAPTTVIEPSQPADAPRPGGKPGPSGPTEKRPTPAEEIESKVEGAVRRYVNAVSDHDGLLLCEMVHGIADLDLPVRRPDCADSVRESIGYRDPRGFPVFDSAVVTGSPEIEVGDRRARAVATVVTEFADRDEPSVEDDVVHLELSAGEWVVAKPSSTIYRAIGISDVPPDVLKPPGGG